MNEQAKKPGMPGGRGGGFEFGRPDGDGRGRGGRDGKRGDKREGGGAGYKIVTELSALEKALTKNDFANQKAPLEAVLRAVKPMRLKSIEDLDMATRGKVITTLMRVVRQPKPKVEAAAPVEAAPEAAPAEAPAEGAPAAEGSPAEAAPAAAPTPAAPPPNYYADCMFTLGLIWRAMGDSDRAAPAFELAGRQPTEADLAVPAAVERPAAAATSDRPRNDRNGPRGARGDRPNDRNGPRTERRPNERGPNSRNAKQPERFARPEPVAPFVSSGDWKVDVETLEKAGRTRDAARIHEKNGSFADAARLFEGGGDLRSALRNAVQAKIDEKIYALMAKLKPDEIEQTLERISAWEKLMEFHVKRAAYDSVAKLYERANQFDQAGIAWEKSGKLAQARKAYERARDFASANRVRDLEVTKLVERGDRLGAATLLVAAGRRREAVDSLKSLPGPKAFNFMQKLKLDEEAKAFAAEQLQAAEASSNHSHRGRWLELLGDLAKAAEAYLAAERKDKASHVFEALGDVPRAAQLAESAGQLDRAQELFKKAGDTANMERVAAMPRPEPKPAHPDAAAENVSEVPSAATTPVVEAPAQTPGASA